MGVDDPNPLTLPLPSGGDVTRVLLQLTDVHATTTRVYNPTPNPNPTP